MASRSFHALFLRARDHFAGSSHWPYLAVLALALIHAVVVTPFIADSRLESQTSLQRTRLATVESSLGELRGALEAVRQETTTMVAPALERLIEDLDGDLARLDVTWRQIVAQAEAEEAEGTATEAPDAPTAETSANAPASSDVQPFLIENPDWIADVRDAQTLDERLAALTPLVEELIVQPRFFDLERDWRDEALPRLEARLDTAAGALPRLRSRFPEAREQWEALTGSLSGLSSVARELKFLPPAEPNWWIRSLTEELVLGLTPEVADEIRRPRRLAELETAADRSVESYSEIVGKVAQAKRELGDPEAGAFSWLDMTAVAMFPLLVGLVLGGTLTWRSQRLRELGFTTRMAIEHGGPPGLRQWLWSQVQWSTSAGASAARAWRACVFQTLLGYFLAMGWIALAAVQLRQLDAAGRQQLMIYAIAGASIVLLAVAHRLLVAHRAILALDEIEESAFQVADSELGIPPDSGTVPDPENAEEFTDSDRAPGGDSKNGDSKSDDSKSGASENANFRDPDDEFIGVRPLRR